MPDTAAEPSEFLKVYPSGDLLIGPMLSEARDISIFAISLRGLINEKPAIVSALTQNSASVRLLMLTPMSDFIRERERQENLTHRNHTAASRDGQISDECRSTVARVEEIIREIKNENRSRRIRVRGEIELRSIATMPYFCAVITEKKIRYAPYFLHGRVGETVAADLQVTSSIAQQIRSDFELMWKNADRLVQAKF